MATPKKSLRDSLDDYAADSKQQNMRSHQARLKKREDKLAQRGIVQYDNNTQSWASKLRDRTTPVKQRPRTVTPSRSSEQTQSPGRGSPRCSPGAGSSHSSPRNSSSRTGSSHSSPWNVARGANDNDQQDLLLPQTRQSPREEHRLFRPLSRRGRGRQSKTPGALNSTVSYVVNTIPKNKVFRSRPSTPSSVTKRFFANAVGRPSSVTKRSGSASPRKSSTDHTPTKSSVLRRHRTPPQNEGEKEREQVSEREGGREGSSSSSAGLNWLAEEEIKLLETLRQCGRETEREWSRIQRSNPELKKIPMPNLGVAAQDRMMKDVKWLLRRKVDELDARAKRMSLRIQSLETDAVQADSRRADLERTIASMVHSHERKLASMVHTHERELQDADRKHQALLGEKEVLLDELAKYNSELQHMKSNTADIKDVVETYKLAKTRCMTSTAELQLELNEVRNALEDEIARAKDLERQSERERVEAEVKIGMLESETRRAQEEVEKEKRRSTHAISEMQRKLSVWSEEGSLAIQEAKRMAEAAEARAHVLEERLEKEAEKELRAEREKIFHEIASEQIALEANHDVELKKKVRCERELAAIEELEKLRAKTEQDKRAFESLLRSELEKQRKSMDFSLRLEFQDQKAELEKEIEQHKSEQLKIGLETIERECQTCQTLNEAQKKRKKYKSGLKRARKRLEDSESEQVSDMKNELQEAKRALGFEQNRVKVAERERDKAERELREAKEKQEEYERVLETATEIRATMNPHMDRFERQSVGAKDDVNMLKRIVSALQIELADEKKENLTCHQTIEDLELKIDMLSEKSRSQQEELNSRQRDQAREREREREKEREERERRERESEDRERQRERQRDTEKERERERESERDKARERDRERDRAKRKQELDHVEKELGRDNPMEMGQGKEEQRETEKELGRRKDEEYARRDQKSSRGRETETRLEDKERGQTKERKKDTFAKTGAGGEEAQKSNNKNDKESYFFSAAESSFEKVQKKMAEIQAAVRSEHSLAVEIDTEKDSHDFEQDIKLGRTNTEGFKTNMLSTSVAFERMQRKMQEISQLVSLDPVWKKKEPEKEPEMRGRVQEIEKENRVEGWTVVKESPKKKTAILYQGVRSREAGGAGAELIARSPFRPVPPPPDPLLDKLIGQIDTLQNEWSSQRPPKTKNVLHLSSQKPITPIRYDRASASRQHEDSAADFSHLQIDTLQNEWISQRPPKTKSLVLISPPKPPSPIRYNRASALRQHSSSNPMTSGRDSERGEMYQEVERERVSPVHVTPSQKKIGLDYTPHGANTAFDTPNRLQSPALRGGKGQKELRISPPRHLEDAFTLAGSPSGSPVCELRVGARLPIKLPVQSLDITRRADSDDSSGEESSLDATVPLLRELANRIAKLPTNVSHDTSSRAKQSKETIGKLTPSPTSKASRRELEDLRRIRLTLQERRGSSSRGGTTRQAL